MRIFIFNVFHSLQHVIDAIENIKMLMLLLLLVGAVAQQDCDLERNADLSLGIPPEFPDFRKIFKETLQFVSKRLLLEGFEEEISDNMSSNENYNCVCAWDYMGGIKRFNENRICSPSPIDVLCPTTTSTTTTTTTTTSTTTTSTTTTSTTTTPTTPTTTTISPTTTNTPAITSTLSRSSISSTRNTQDATPTPGDNNGIVSTDVLSTVVPVGVDSSGEQTTSGFITPPPALRARKPDDKEMNWLPIVLGLIGGLVLFVILVAAIVAARKHCTNASEKLRRKRSDRQPITQQTSEDTWSSPGSRTPSMYSQSGSQRFTKRINTDARRWSSDLFLEPGQQDEKLSIGGYNPGESSTDKTLERKRASGKGSTSKRASKKASEANNNRLSKDSSVHYKKKAKNASVSSRSSTKSSDREYRKNRESTQSSVTINIGNNRDSPIIFGTIDKKDTVDRNGGSTMKQGISYVTYENEAISDHNTTRSSPDEMSIATLDTTLDVTLDTSMDATLDNFDSVLDECANDNESFEFDRKSHDSVDPDVQEWKKMVEAHNSGYTRLAEILNDSEDLVDNQNAHLFAYQNPAMDSSASLNKEVLDPPSEFKDPSRQGSMRSNLTNLSVPKQSTPSKPALAAKPYESDPRTTPPTPPAHSHKATNTQSPANDIKPLPKGPIIGHVNPAFTGSVESLAGLGDNTGTTSSTGSGSNIAIVQPQRPSVKKLTAKFEPGNDNKTDKYNSLPNPKRKSAKPLDLGKSLEDLTEDNAQFATLQSRKANLQKNAPAAVHKSFLHSQTNGHLPNGHVNGPSLSNGDMQSQPVENGIFNIQEPGHDSKVKGSFLWSQYDQKDKPSAQVPPVMFENEASSDL